MLWNTYLWRVSTRMQAGRLSAQRSTQPKATSQPIATIGLRANEEAVRRQTSTAACAAAPNRLWVRDWTTPVRDEILRLATDSLGRFAGQQRPDLARAHVEEGVVLEQVHVRHQHLAPEPRARAVAILDHLLPDQFG